MKTSRGGREAMFQAKPQKGKLLRELNEVSE